MIWRE